MIYKILLLESMTTLIQNKLLFLDYKKWGLQYALLNISVMSNYVITCSPKTRTYTIKQAVIFHQWGINKNI